MEVGPTTHYIMGGCAWMPRRRCPPCPACSPPASARPGINGANRLGGNSLSDLLVFGKRAGEYAARFREATAAGRIDDRQVEPAPRDARRAVRSRRVGREPVPGAARSPGDDAGPRRHRSRRDGDARGARGAPEAHCGRAPRVGASRPPRVQHRLAHRARPAQPADVSEAITRSAIERKESRGGALSARTIPTKIPRSAASTSSCGRPRRRDAGVARRFRRCRGELKQIIEENK